MNRRQRMRDWYEGEVKRKEILPAYCIIAAAVVVGTFGGFSVLDRQAQNQRADIDRNTAVTQVIGRLVVELCKGDQASNDRTRALVLGLVANSSQEQRQRVISILDETNPEIIDCAATLVLASDPTSP